MSNIPVERRDYTKRQIKSVHGFLLLEKHIESTTYTGVIDICTYVETEFGVCYTVSDMTKWLKAYRFSYKQPKATRVKVDVAQQEAFIASYFTFLESALKNEPIVFIDSAHPNDGHQNRLRLDKESKGKDKPLIKTGAKTRVNVIGAIELSTMKVVSACSEQVNSETTMFF